MALLESTTTPSLLDYQATNNAEFRRIYWLGRSEAIDHFNSKLHGLTAESLSRDDLLNVVHRCGRELAQMPVLRDIDELPPHIIKSNKELNDALHAAYIKGEESAANKMEIYNSTGANQ